MDFRVKKFPRVGRIPRPEDGLRAVVEKAPQAEALAERWLEKSRPFLSVLYADRRRLATGAVAVLTMWLFLHVMFGANGMVVYRSKRTERQKLQAEIEKLQRENDLYEQQIKALQNDPQAIEKEAREQLHYTRPGEVVYVQPAPTRPRNNTAQK
jgi:cell division protein FtsB